jgi:hypothetical protein
MTTDLPIIEADNRLVRWMRYQCPACLEIVSTPLALVSTRHALLPDVFIDFVLCLTCERLRIGLPAEPAKRPRNKRKISENRREDEPRNAGNDQLVYYPTSI